MNWYYVENSRQAGPVDDAQFEALVREGRITPATLVWREGLANWAPYSQATAPAGTAVTFCAECGQAFATGDLIQIEGRSICANCKPVVMQRLKEGASAGAAPIDPDVLANQIIASGYEIDIGACISRSFALVRENFWLACGATFLVYLMMTVGSSIPCVGSLISLVINGPLLGGLYWLFLKLIRKQPASVSDAFAGFSRNFAQLMLCAIVMGVAFLVFFAPGFIMMIVRTKPNQDYPDPLALGLFALALVPIMWLSVAWIFALPLIVDKSIAFWPAMQVSMKIANRRWWRIFGLMCVTGLIIFGALLVAGLLVAALIAARHALGTAITVSFGVVLVLGSVFLFFALAPVAFAAIMHAYEDVFGQRAAPPA
jgi:uncharacterized protein DUF4339